MPGPFKDGLQMATISECRYRWLRVPATTDTDAPVVKAAGAFFLVTIPIACLEALLYDRFWRKAGIHPQILHSNSTDSCGVSSRSALERFSFSADLPRFRYAR